MVIMDGKGFSLYYSYTSTFSFLTSSKSKFNTFNTLNKLWAFKHSKARFSVIPIVLQ